MSISYPLGQVGNFFVYLFVIFAAYDYRAPIVGFAQALLPVMTRLSCFGSPTSTVNAVAFLSAGLPLPDAAPQLHVELATITRFSSAATGGAPDHTRGKLPKLWRGVGALLTLVFCLLIFLLCRHLAGSFRSVRGAG